MYKKIKFQVIHFHGTLQFSEKVLDNRIGLRYNPDRFSNSFIQK
jgi:hypothetical protein